MGIGFGERMQHMMEMSDIGYGHYGIIMFVGWILDNLWKPHRN